MINQTPTFLTGGGRVGTDFGLGFAQGTDVVQQPDGKIVVVGQGLDHYALARFDADGKIDATFGTAGITTTLAAPKTTSVVGPGVSAVALQPDGRIVVTGADDGTDAAVVLRYDIH